ncbi:uncharacterized protein [Halyomorpha halys]|uniref:uncharacterized protein n=1 Tax=Halyomorpha halys TaxID=286706 RepID=UPI000D0C7B81|nr:uncharacterized protein LOC106692403 [Halyomorpha halys]
MRAIILLLAALTCWSRRVLRCGQQVQTDTPDYYFTSACTRSRMTQVASSYIGSLVQCKKFAARRRGLALNFVYRDLLYDDVKNYSGPTCLVFDCPEFDVQLSFDMDTIFDYYTAYARPMPTINQTCLPRIGVYLVHRERKNFTEARDTCESEDGYLADISNAPKTVQLASALAKEHIRKAFVGLSQEEGYFITSQDMPLDCLRYRAWAPGEPKDNRECATLSSKGYWYTKDCSKRMPFICELQPSGPLRPCAHLSWRRRNVCREKFGRSFPNQRRWPKCGDPSIEENTFKLPVFKKRKIQN